MIAAVALLAAFLSTPLAYHYAHTKGKSSGSKKADYLLGLGDILEELGMQEAGTELKCRGAMVALDQVRVKVAVRDVQEATVILNQACTLNSFPTPIRMRAWPLGPNEGTIDIWVPREREEWFRDVLAPISLEGSF